MFQGQLSGQEKNDPDKHHHHHNLKQVLANRVYRANRAEC